MPSKSLLKRIGVDGAVLFVAVAASQILNSNCHAQSAVPPKKAALAGTPGRFPTNQLQRRADLYYAEVWGIDSLQVKYTESGEMIRFSYRVVDPEKAALLNDKKIEPALEDPQAGVKLTIPQMENVGKLRQSSEPEPGKSYWMAFSNVGRRVRPGHHVDVVIGHFRAQGLVVNDPVK